MKRNFLYLMLLFWSTNGYTAGPWLAFTDLVSGPDIGVGDGLGSGAIVTMWGFALGSSQGNSFVEFCDVQSICRFGHVYYWKNADGQLPSGPANLYESHGMQEIAFSIPDSATGAGTLRVTVSGVASNELPFSVGNGSIFHVKSTGTDSNDGSFNSPWLTIDHGEDFAGPGDLLYLHDLTEGSYGTKEVLRNSEGFKAGRDNNMAYVSYPNTRSVLIGGIGFRVPNGTEGITMAKIVVQTSNCEIDGVTCAVGTSTSGSLGIMPTDKGRVIANEITNIPGKCATGSAGALSPTTIVAINSPFSMKKLG